MAFGRSSTVVGILVAGLAWAGGGAPARAQTPPGADAEASQEGRPHLIQSRDWILGAVFFGSFAATQVDPLDEIDGILAPQTGGHGDFHRALGRNYGRLSIISALSAGTILGGEIAGSETTARIGLRSVESLLLNAALTTVTKIGFGRSRPYTDAPRGHYEPFSYGRDEWSFPSGHTSNTFAVATTLVLELGDEAPWLPFLVYPLAGWTGVTRILDEKHYFTDVVAGAALGIFSARVIHRLHEAEEASPRREPGSGITPRLLLSTGPEFLVGVGLSFN